ncbi:hypothetical protein WJU23_16285 [Prosthecobacter sp. SYSU 5D2]|uniref:hypothetical protein n=1 Tax=Prosthecobacter sp. SYSU 5D2 TaxID=3134134 RepID=UPI0031FE53F8
MLTLTLILAASTDDYYNARLWACRFILLIGGLGCCGVLFAWEQMQKRLGFMLYWRRGRIRWFRASRLGAFIGALTAVLLGLVMLADTNKWDRPQWMEDWFLVWVVVWGLVIVSVFIHDYFLHVNRDRE